MQKKNTIIIVSLIVIFMLGWKLMVYKQNHPNPIQVPVTSEKTATSSPASTLGHSTTTGEATPITTKPIDDKTKTINEAWTLFQNYLTAAKNHDIKTVTNLSYQISDTCKDPKQLTKCNTLMDNAYGFGNEMKKSDYTNAWYDNKQIILFTKENVVATSTVKGTYRGFVYFTRDNGTIKFLSLNPEVGAYVKTENKTPTEVDAELQAMVKDIDQDGLADTLETCKDSIDSTCKKTDPNKRDTNGNGWWDGIENLFYIKP